MIDTQAIRNKILDLAMRGQLTEQLPEDGTAEELYQQILEEKQKLIKEGKIKKQKPLPKINDEEIPFDIPDNWKWIRFSDLYSLSNGVASRGTEGGTLYPVLRLADLSNGLIVLSNIRSIALSNKEFSTHKIQCGDIVFIRVNGSRDKVANAFLYLYDKEISYCDHLFCAHKVTNLFVPSYIMNIYRSKFIKVQIDPEIKTTAGQNTINQRSMGKIIIPLPPIDEQKRIVEKIEQAYSILDTIDKLQAQYVDNFTALKSKLIDAAIQGKLTEQLPEDGTAEELYTQIQAEKQRLISEGKIKKEKPLPEISEEEIPFDIPDNWKWVRFSDVLDVRDGTHDTPKYVNEGIPLVTSKNLKDGQIDYSSAKLISNEDAEMINKRSLVDDGDILLAMIGTIGNPVLVKKDRNFCIKNVALFKPVNQNLLDMMYVLFYLIFEQYVMREKARGGLQPFVSLTILRKTIFPLPPLAEQKRIVQKLEQILPLCEG